MAVEAHRISVRGVVQGVGFRPFVYRIALGSGVAGYVANTAGDVVVHAEGEPEAIGRFLRRLRDELPPAARIARWTRRRVAPQGFGRFAIAESLSAGTALSTIPPDLATCAPCLEEMSDPANRRHRYPFTNCTNCGPRFTIVRRLPYDRGNTSMDAFPLCPECLREYEAPADRRYHAEPTACPACGPRLFAAGKDGEPQATGDPLGAAADALREGRIVAVRGLGGFQLACDATDDGAVRALRERKHREEKPFAVMVPDLAAARAAARLGAADEAILRAPSAPILLAEARPGSPLSRHVSPGLSTVGIFLPYTPLHHLLLRRTGRPLVMTSGNVTDEPIATGNGEAISRLRGIADLFLLHDREILQRADDTVVRRVGRTPYPIRRARGAVPSPVVVRGVPAGRGKRPKGRTGGRAVAGLGGDLKGTFCFLKEGLAWLSQHLGDLEHAPVREFYAESFFRFREFLGADLAAVCRDLHPAYFTSSFAETLPGVRILSLQHHKAHLYALLAESGFRGKAVGVAFDGTGYGEDGSIWGGEFFRIDGLEMVRAGSLSPFPLQGGDSSVRDPWKTALSLLAEAFGPAEGLSRALALFRDVDPAAVSLVASAISAKVNVVPTTSCGRLFDGISAIAGVCRRQGYEGQAPMLLEGAARRARAGPPYPFRLAAAGDRLAVDWRETVAGAAEDARRGAGAPAIARRFHDAVAEMILAAASRLAEESGARTVLLSGGVFQNGSLLGTVIPGFRNRGIRPLVHREVPANDGGISLGQAYYAAHAAGG